MKWYEPIAFMVGVLLAAALLAIGADACSAGNCVSHNWQQTTVTDCKCWYKKCDGKCTRTGMWDGERLTCTCPVISTCSDVDIVEDVFEDIVEDIVEDVAVDVVEDVVRVELTSDEKICRWYPGLDPLPEMVEGEIRRDPTTDILWKCLADGTTVKLLDGNLPAEETLTHNEKPWPGGFMGCLRTYGTGWRLSRSKGVCIKYVITKP